MTCESLCKAFVYAVLKLEEWQRIAILFPTVKDPPPISWDSPFLYDRPCKNIIRTWNGQGIGRGCTFIDLALIQIYGTSNESINTKGLQLIQALIQSELIKQEKAEKEHSEDAGMQPMSTEKLDELYINLNEQLFCSLGNEATTVLAWEVFVSFMLACTPEVVTKVICANSRLFPTYWLLLFTRILLNEPAVEKSCSLALSNSAIIRVKVIWKGNW
jgi:hypothetical protein